MYITTFIILYIFLHSTVSKIAALTLCKILARLHFLLQFILQFPGVPPTSIFRTTPPSTTRSYLYSIIRSLIHSGELYCAFFKGLLLRGASSPVTEKRSTLDIMVAYDSW